MNGAAGNANSRKRGRELATASIAVPMVFATSPAVVQPPPAMIGLSQLSSPPPPPPTLVSTGLRLAIDEQNLMHQPYSTTSAFVSEDLAPQINQQKDEIEQFLLAQVPSSVSSFPFCRR